MRVSLSVVSFVASTTFLMGTTSALASPAWDEEPLGAILTFPSTTFSTSGGTRKNLRRAARRGPPEDSSHRHLSTVKVGMSPGCDSHYDTIMEALDNEDSSLTIELCAETYNEDILIQPDFEVTIKGEGMGLSIIKPSGTPLALLNAAAGNIKVELEMLTLDGDNNLAGREFCENINKFGTCGVAGLACEDCDAKVREVEFINIASLDPETIPSFDIFARSRTPGAGYKITVEESEFATAGTIGVFVDGPGLEAEIKKNNITSGNAPSTRTFGIQGSRQAKVKIESNTLTGYSDTDGPSQAITMFCPRSDSFVKKNQINDADVGVILINADRVYVEDNDIDSTGAAVQLQYSEVDVEPTDCPVPLGVTNNKIKDNTIFNTTFGVTFLSDPSVENSTLTDNKVESNDITDSRFAGIVLLTGDENTIKYNIIERSANGIVLDDPIGAGFLAPPAGGNLIKQNDIFDSENLGISVEAGQENIFESNVIVNSGDSGIGISGGSDSLFKNNKIINSAANGIVVYEGVGYLLEGNDVDISDVGFNIRVGAVDTVLEKNKVENSDPPLLDAGTNTILIDNDF